MTDDDLLSLILSRSTTAETSLQPISDERQAALQYYRQDKFGNEQDGRSQVITSDVRDVIEWVLPQLVEIFLGPDAPCEFKPENASDIEAAEQQTKYVRYVFNQQNDGFLNLYTWIKDALLYKNGIIKCYWEEEEEREDENYKNINVVELEYLKADKKLDITKIIAKVNDEIIPEASLGSIPIDQITFDVEAQRVNDCSKVEICPVAPENFVLDPDYASVDLSDCDFCRENSYMTESELLEEGFDQDVIDLLPTYNPSERAETQNRFVLQGGLVTNSNNNDKSTRKIKISDVYIKCDYSGKGKAERRFIKIGGDAKILENEPCDYIPYRAITPFIMTHQFTGMSLADMVKDLQLLKSTLWRQSLDSLYLSNNPRYTIVKGAVELDDLLVSRPGGIIRQDMPGAVGTLETPFVGANSMPMMELIDKMREERTGVSSVTQGLDPNALADSTNLVGSMIMNAAQARVKMIARVIAETGYKSLMMLIHRLVIQYEENEKIADLNDGKYTPINPSTWKTRRDMTVKVGIGNSDRTQKIMSLERMLTAQQQIFTNQQGEGPLLNSQNVYNTLTDMMKLIGMDTQDRYFSDPAKYQAPPPPPPSVQERTVDVAEAEIQLQANKAASQHELDVTQHQDDIRLKWAELIQKDKLERDKLKLEENKELGALALEAIRMGNEQEAAREAANAKPEPTQRTIRIVKNQDMINETNMAPGTAAE